MKILISLIFTAFLLLTNGSVSEISDSSKQSFVNPLNTNAEILSGYGLKTHPVIKEERKHSGIDFKVSIGDHVHASASGTISFIGKSGSYGNLIKIQHSEGYETRYAHLSDFQEDLVEGSTVESGQLIAFAGNTGSTTGPILHFELLLDGESVNPLLYLK